MLGHPKLMSYSLTLPEECRSVILTDFKKPFEPKFYVSFQFIYEKWSDQRLNESVIKDLIPVYAFELFFDILDSSIFKLLLLLSQDNGPLMRALAKLIAVNDPDLVLFVGEALVGNEAVDQVN